MRLLFDQGTPVPLRHHLLAHSVETAYERGWSTFKNGDLLSSAEADGFDGIVQSNILSRPLDPGFSSTRLQSHTYF